MSDSLLLAELLEEICQRLEAGESVDMHMYTAKHPELASQLEQLVPAMTVLGELSQSSTDTATSPLQESAAPNFPPLGDYRLVRQIGRGGMGVVYEAEQMSLARRVALKILPFASLWTETSLERFRNEVRIAAMLEHPNIVPIYGMGCERGVYFYAMKLIDGCSLSEVIGQRKLQTAEHSTESQTLDPKLGSADDTVVAVTTAVMGDDNWYRTTARLGQAAAKALAFAHEQGVIHRDIKPSNLLLDRQGRLFIADFGLARLETDVSLTRTGDLLGTPRYMSPEQASGSSKQLDPRSDIYSLGATLYELLTLRPVISGPSRAAAIRELQDLQVTAPRTHDANIPLALEQIVLKCLQPDPNDRYATAGALAEDLSRYLAGQPVLARAPGVVRRTSRWIQRHPQSTLGMLAVLVLFSSVSTVSFWMTHQDWFGTSAQRGPPGGEFVETDKLTTIPPNFQSPEESPDMLRSSKNNRNGNNNKSSNNRLFGVEKLEGRALMAGDVSISITDANIKEQGNLSTFISGDTGTLHIPGGMAFGTDRNGDSRNDLYVIGSPISDTNAQRNIRVYDGQTGNYIEDFAPSGAGLYRSAWMTFGPDGDLFTSNTPNNSGSRNEIVRVDQVTKAVTTFVPRSANGGLDTAKGLTFGPDGNLYVASERTNQVLRYNGTTGAFIDVFASAGNASIGWSGVLFGPDRNGDSTRDLYVGNNESDEVLVFDGEVGAPLGVFVTAASGGIDGPHDMQFGPDGNLYVASSVNTLNFDQVEQVYRYDGTTGAFIDVPVAVGSGLGGATTFLTFDPQGDLLVSGQGAGEVLRYSAGPLVTLTEASANPVTIDFSTVGLTASAGSDFMAVTGRLTFSSGETSKRILVTAADDGVNESNEIFAVNLSNPTGAIIGDNQAEITIFNSQTKFFVVNDATASASGQVFRDETYKYDSAGALVVSNDVYFNANAVRGVASNVSGTRLWTIDSNGTVYVSDNRNLYLGSWFAGGLTNPQGITVSGNDIWIVDASSDKVFKYTGAASRLSGSQSPTNNQSFKLSNANKDATDLVTDGTSIWVLNNTTSADKVFKYNLAGVLQAPTQGSTIASGGGDPTGITLDPSNATQDLWIVDRNTDKVYRLPNGRTTTATTITAVDPFDLAPGNTNPQGIADPPPPNSSLSTASSVDVGNNTLALSAIAGAFLQAPIVSLGVLSTERVASLRSRVEVTEKVVESMSQLSNGLPVASIAVMKASSTPITSRPRSAEEQSIDLALADEELNDSLFTIANELHESTFR